MVDVGAQGVGVQGGERRLGPVVVVRLVAGGEDLTAPQRSLGQRVGPGLLTAHLGTDLRHLGIGLGTDQCCFRTGRIDIDAQHNRLKDAFGGDAYIHIDPRHLNFADPDSEIAAMDRQAWSCIVNVSGMRSLLSVKAARELDEQLDHGKLPSITEETVNGFIGATKDQAIDRLADAVKEVHGFLRPPSSRFKTNSEFDIGKRVVLSYWVQAAWVRGLFQPYHDRQSEFRALDNVFCLLDGKPITTTHYGPLSDAIRASEDGIGETEYFKFRACKNNNPQ